MTIQTLDKSLLKREIDKTPAKDILVLTVSAMEKDPMKHIKTDAEKFLSKSADNIVLIIRR